MLPRMIERIDRCRAGRLDPELARQADLTHGLYAGWDLYAGFIRERVPPGAYLLAGTGPASRALAAALAASPVRIAGLLDPAQAGPGPGAPVLLCNRALARPLRAAGLEPGRILDVAAMEGFAACHDARVAELAEGLAARIGSVQARTEHVILVPNRDLWMVVEEEVLRSVLPPESTVRLYYGPPGRMDESPVYPSFDCGQCLPLLLAVLERLAPRSILFRGSAQFKSEHVGAVVRDRFPGAFFAFEVYDYAGMLEDLFLETWGFTPELAGAVREAEAFLAARADFLLDKTPGDEWTRAAREHVRAPRRAYHPALGVDWREPPPPSVRQGPLRLLCAGSMPYFRNFEPGRGFERWAYPDIIDPILDLGREADLRVDVFNASHDPGSPEHEAAFEGYRELFAGLNVAYHPRIPLEAVLARAPAYDFGLFCFAASPVVVDYPLQQSLPNRCMTYLAGGLPLVVNTEMRHLAALVAAFGAGIAVSADAVPDLPRRLREADLPALRRGARALHRHLVEANAEAVAAYRQALAAHPGRA
jgi:hypothetical protein